MCKCDDLSTLHSDFHVRKMLLKTREPFYRHEKAFHDMRDAFMSGEPFS